MEAVMRDGIAASITCCLLHRFAVILKLGTYGSPGNPPFLEPGW